jgi:hypothetical protein
MLFGKFIDASGSLAFELSFLARAVSDDLTHYVMNQIYVEPSEIKGLKGVATDGRRLHIVDPFDGLAGILGLSPGYWKVIKNSKRTVWITRLDDSETTKWDFPNYRAVIPEGEAVYKTTFEGFSFGNQKSNYPGLIEFIRNFPDATAINLEKNCGNCVDLDEESGKTPLCQCMELGGIKKNTIENKFDHVCDKWEFNDYSHFRKETKGD